MLTQEQIKFYNDHGYLHIPAVFNPVEIEELSDEMDRLVQDWALTNEGWTGPWRQAYMDPKTEKQSKLTSMHDLHFSSRNYDGASSSKSDKIKPYIENSEPWEEIEVLLANKKNNKTGLEEVDSVGLCLYKYKK